HGKKVGVQTRGHIYQQLRGDHEINLLEYPTTTAAMEDLNKGLLDAVPEVERIALYYKNLRGWDIKSAGEPIISLNICTGFSKMLDPSIIERYNRALTAIMSDGRYERLYEGYFGELKDRDRP
nr:transporter substrate-binding domain-containing protein [Spirochaetaceae bacterium]